MQFRVPREEIVASNEMIESGVYFEESRRWYNDMFLSPFVSRSAYLIFFVLYSVSIYLAISFAFSLFPLQETKEMIIKTKRDSDTYINKIHLTQFDTPAKNILAEMLKNYVLQREQYVLNDMSTLDVIKKKTNFIRRYSSQKVYANFKEELNIKGGKADRLMLNNYETKIKILNISFLADDISIFQGLINNFLPTVPPTVAQVSFVINGQNRTAVISYIFELPNYNAKNRDAEIKLNVIDYNVMRTN